MSDKNTMKERLVLDYDLRIHFTIVRKTSQQQPGAAACSHIGGSGTYRNRKQDGLRELKILPQEMPFFQLDPTL